MRTQAASVRTQSVEEIVRSLPRGSYGAHFQPRYNDEEALRQVIEALRRLPGITSAGTIRRLRSRLQAIATGQAQQPILVEGPCAEHVGVPLSQLVVDVLRRKQAIHDSLGDTVLHVQRRVQSIKPRTAETEAFEAGELTSYMGDGINGASADERTPNAWRLVQMAKQARALELCLRHVEGRHTFAAHEALSVAYESAMMMQAKDGKRYLVSADLPWVGARTNQPGSAQVRMLVGIENPIGVKLGDSTTAGQIQQLTQLLNPRLQAGKLLWMLRLTPAGTPNLPHVLTAIGRASPGSLILYDIHGVTRQAGGRKLRAVMDIIRQIRHVHAACLAAGLRLHGLHLEAMGDDLAHECIDSEHPVPTRSGNVDPQLNPTQLRTVLNAVADVLGARAQEHVS